MIMIKESDNRPLADLVNALVPHDLSERESVVINRWQEVSLTSFLIESDGKLLGVWGIIAPSILSTEVYLWLHVTPHIKEHQFVFVRHSQLVRDELLKEYNAIVGHVSADAPHSRRWLKWLGAKFDDKPGPLISFRIERKWPTQ